MNNRLLFFILTVGFSLAGSAKAQDGGQLYATYCAACHAPEGQGQPDSGMPPLAGSRWVAGEPKRAIQIVLHGLMGPIEVNGRNYDSVMPAQGAIIPDDHLAATLNYVRSSWGNKEPVEITEEMVAEERARTAQRKAPWEAVELLKQFPLPEEEVFFTQIGATYRVTKNGPEKTVSAADLPQNLLSMDAIGEPLKKGGSVTFTGEVTATRDDSYTLLLATNFVASLEVGGKKRFESKRPGKPAEPVPIDFDLKKGVYPFVMTLTKKKDGDAITFSWKSGESPIPKSLIYGQSVAAREIIELIPKDEIYLYRGSIRNAGSPRVIAVGSPSGLHYTFDPVTGAPTLVWSGHFLDAQRHWTGRGKGLEAPMGREISKIVPGIAWLQEMPDEWPLYDVEESEIDVRKREMNYHGFQYDEDRLGLTFAYSIGEQRVTDHYRAVDGKLLERTISHRGSGPLYLKVLERSEGDEVSGTSPFVIDQSTVLEISDSAESLKWLRQDRTSPRNSVRQVGILELAPGSTHTLTYHRDS